MEINGIHLFEHLPVAKINIIEDTCLCEKIMKIQRTRRYEGINEGMIMH